MPTWVERIGGSSITLGGELTDGDTVLARGHAVVVGFDRGAQRSRPLTDGEKDRIGVYQLG